MSPPQPQAAPAIRPPATIARFLIPIPAPVIISFLAIVALLLLNAFFVAAEFSLARAKRTRLEALSRTGDRRARIALRATTEMGRMLSASQLGITLASLGLGWVTIAMVGEMLRSPIAARWPQAAEPAALTIAVAVALLVVAYAHVVIGELVPRAIASAHSERLVRWLAPPLTLFARITAPVLALISGSARLIAPGAIPALEEEIAHSPEELRVLVEQSEEEGRLEPQDAELIEGVFEFSEKDARGVMTPRTDIVALPVDATLESTVAVIEEGGFSRYPVYEESIDDIVGIVLAKDLLPVLHRGAEGFSLRSILRAVHVVPGTRQVEEVLADFKLLKEHMAIVLDEYGGTAGLVTMEDLLEEIVGEIFDEYDEPDPLPPSGTAGEVLVPGTTHIGELNERFGLSVPDEHFTTIGGFVFGSIGRLPTVGDRITAGGAVFTVQSMEGRRIETLAVDLHSAGDRRGSVRERQNG